MTVAHVAGLVAASLAAAASAEPVCGGDLAGTRHLVESPRYTIAYTTVPDPISVGQHFVVDFSICARNGLESPRVARIDANMPEHRHGMNYRPGVTVVRPGLYRAEGLMFHMPGRWDLTFDVVAGNTTERLASTLRVE